MWLKKKLPVLVILGACILVFTFFQKKEDYIDEYNAKIDALEAKVDSLHSINDELVIKIDTLNQQVVKLDKEIDQKDNKIYNLRNEINTKVNAVDSFTDDELERFFTERYRQHRDSIKKTDSSPRY